MFKKLAVLSTLVVACNAYAEVQSACYCMGMARALKLPDEKVFNTFYVVEEQLALSSYGKTSDEYLKLVQQRAYEQGMGTGLGIAILKDKGTELAFKVFMRNCYDNDTALRQRGLDIEYPRSSTR